MQDLNSLYTEHLIATINRERQEQRRIAEATAGRPSPWQRLVTAIREMRPARIEPAGARRARGNIMTPYSVAGMSPDRIAASTAWGRL